MKKLTLKLGISFISVMVTPLWSKEHSEKSSTGDLELNQEKPSNRDFSDFLVTCSSTMPHIPGLQVSNECEEIQKLLKNLPNLATKRWNRYVTRALDKGMPYPNFNDFTEFVAEKFFF